MIDAQAGDGVSLASCFRASYWVEAMGVSEPDGRNSGDNSIILVMRDECSVSSCPHLSLLFCSSRRTWRR